VVELLTISEVSAALQVSTMTVYRFISDGRLPAIRIGNSLRVHRDDLDAHLRSASPPSLDSERAPAVDARTSSPPDGVTCRAAGLGAVASDSADEPAVIVIVDGHEMFATSLRMALRVHGLEACQGPIGSHIAALDYVRELRAKVVVLELRLGHDSDGRLIDLVGPLTRLGAAVLVVSGGRDRPREAAAVAAGAVGLVPKTSSLTTLLDAIHAAGAGRTVMPEDVRQTWLRVHDQCQTRQRDYAQRLERLSVREREVLALLVAGHRAAAIAEHFVVSMTTVRTQIAAILAKLEVSSQLEAVALIANR
jgi:excisionase family DNA binding protein